MGQVGDLPLGPWSDMVLLVDWDLLSPPERDAVLEKSASSPCLALIVIAPLLSGDDARHMLHASVADIVNSANELAAITSAVERQSIRLAARRQWLNDQEKAAQILHHLTPREQDILRALHGGSSNKYAARLLGISPRTVEAHRANMLRRTGMACIADLLKIQTQMDQARAALAHRSYDGTALHEADIPPDSQIGPNITPPCAASTPTSPMRWN
jgi:two-component system response regulator FixJ